MQHIARATGMAMSRRSRRRLDPPAARPPCQLPRDRGAPERPASPGYPPDLRRRRGRADLRPAAPRARDARTRAEPGRLTSALCCLHRARIEAHRMRELFGDLCAVTQSVRQGIAVAVAPRGE